MITILVMEFKIPPGCLNMKQNIHFGEIYTDDYFCTANFVDHNQIVRAKIKCGKHLVPSALYDMVVHQSPGAS